MSSSVTSIALLQKRVGQMLPSLSKAEAIVLGYLSYGILMLNGCGMSRLSNGLAKIEQVPAGRLREFYYEAEAKRGNKRREVNVQACFADLLRCVLRGWQGKKELALAMDASTLGERFTVLSISVMYRGCGIPIAWKIIEAMEEGAWHPHWEGLLATLEGVVPPDWKVILMADRGLYAAWLYQAIQRLGWHPMLRVKEDLSFRATGEENFSPMGMQVKRRGRGWSGKGQWSEHGERMEGTVLIRWEKGYEEKLVVVTDLDEKEANAAWYQMRFWIEDEYKDHKSGGWQHTKMTDPKRAERQWLARAVAMQIAVLVGGQEEAQEQEHKRKAGKRLKEKRRAGRPPKPRYDYDCSCSSPNKPVIVHMIPSCVHWYKSHMSSLASSYLTGELSLGTRIGMRGKFLSFVLANKSNQSISQNDQDWMHKLIKKSERAKQCHRK